MAAELMFEATLDQGTPVFWMPYGYKKCGHPGRYLAYKLGEELLCPGCKLTCKLPKSYWCPKSKEWHDLERGQSIVVTDQVQS